MAITSRKYVRNCRHIRQRKKFSVIFATTLTFDGLLSCYSSRIPNTDEVSDASRDIKYLIRTVWDGLPVISTKKHNSCCFVCYREKHFEQCPLDRVSDAIAVRFRVMATTRSHVEEDTVEYWLFPNLSEDADVFEQLDTFRTKCFTYLHKLSQNYVWNEESINLSAIPQRTIAGKSCVPL